MKTRLIETRLNSQPLLLLAAISLTMLLLAPASVRAGDNNSIKVDRVDFSVTLSDGSAQRIAGYLYYHGSYRNRTLQVLVHGATYNHTYWDAPTINGREYSYARYMAERKYAVLAIDQLGAGESSKPDGNLVTLAETSGTLHQVLSQLRTENNPTGYAFKKIVLVGHSFGSINAIVVQANFHDADALITTAYGHEPHPLPIPEEFIVSLFSAGPYFTLPAPFRTALFYHQPTADPAVIAYDNANMADSLTQGQLRTTFFTIFGDPVGGVTGPVLVQLGQHDALWPSAFASTEAAFWTGTPDVTVQSLADVGHDFNLHLDNQTGWRGIDSWVASKVGRK